MSPHNIVIHTFDMTFEANILKHLVGMIAIENVTPYDTFLTNALSTAVKE